MSTHDPGSRPDAPAGGPFGTLVTGTYPEGPADPVGRGARTPLHQSPRCEGTGECALACPTQAIEVTGRGKGATFQLDYGRCVFCRACVDVCPTGALIASADFELSVRRREDLVVRHGAGRAPPTYPVDQRKEAETQARIQRLFGGSLAIREVDAGSCNGCEVEVSALTWPRFDSERLGIHFVASPRHADALLVTGPVNVNMRLALEKTFRATPSPKIVLAVGACGISGGPFRDSAEVRNGVAPTLPVTVFIPGCPPRPEALLYGIWLALGKLEQRVVQGELPTAASGTPKR